MENLIEKKLDNVLKAEFKRTVTCTFIDNETKIERMKDILFIKTVLNNLDELRPIIEKELKNEELTLWEK